MGRWRRRVRCRCGHRLSMHAFTKKGEGRCYGKECRCERFSIRLFRQTT